MRKYSGVQFNFHYAFHVDGPNYCKPAMKGGHTHNHVRNAHKRMRKCHICGEPMPCYPAKDVDESIAELKAEINRKEAVGKKWFERCMEARAENVMLKRALWIARSERAKTTQLLLKNAIDHLESKYKHRFDNMRLQFHVWGVVKRKCRAKAEEYK